MKFISALFLLFLLTSVNKHNPVDVAIKPDNAAIGLPFAIQELTDEAYPDNPDIGYRSKHYASDFFESGLLQIHNRKEFSFIFYSTETYGDTIALRSINLDEFIPRVPRSLRSDPYLSHLSIVNQEWNRNQVRFNIEQFTSTSGKYSRVDLARNCLNAHLWEFIVYIEEDGKEVPIYHAWFNFPATLYSKLFEDLNEVAYSTYQTSMENWIDPESKVVNRDVFRKIQVERAVTFNDLSEQMYPKKGAREKKFKEIITPTSFETMRDLQQDQTTLATFSPPGFYNKADPRHTELGRFYRLKDIRVHQIRAGSNDASSLQEIELIFSDREKKRTTTLVLGGFDISQFPTLSVEEANSGWKNSMGFGNHPFYETYDEHQLWEIYDNPYYGFLTDETERWLDSHKIGIDGPLFHIDQSDDSILHLWLLSFERHALVGHYEIKFKKGI